MLKNWKLVRSKKYIFVLFLPDPAESDRGADIVQLQVRVVLRRHLRNMPDQENRNDLCALITSTTTTKPIMTTKNTLMCFCGLIFVAKSGPKMCLMWHILVVLTLTTTYKVVLMHKLPICIVMDFVAGLNFVIIYWNPRLKLIFYSCCSRHLYILQN